MQQVSNIVRPQIERFRQLYKSRVADSKEFLQVLNLLVESGHFVAICSMHLLTLQCHVSHVIVIRSTLANVSKIVLIVLSSITLSCCLSQWQRGINLAFFIPNPMPCTSIFAYQFGDRVVQQAWEDQRP